MNRVIARPIARIPAMFDSWSVFQPVVEDPFEQEALVECGGRKRAALGDAALDRSASAHVVGSKRCRRGALQRSAATLHKGCLDLAAQVKHWNSTRVSILAIRIVNGHDSPDY
ncbi:MAG TPA: hypothetical protein PLS90_09020 [Candidatus Sumerlaeota bacterium]|nr:hypothetical protein [Candidatus Sumerlaeota bacterium]HPK02585.1 hypothetical protein [Candidatus Sumerlaeota bacterium]